EDQVARLAGSGRRVAQGTREEVPEDVGNADGGARHAETGDTGADVLCGFSFHCVILSKPWNLNGVYWELMRGVERIVEIHGGEDGKDVSLNRTHQEFETGDRHAHDERQRGPQ